MSSGFCNEELIIKDTGRLTIGKPIYKLHQSLTFEYKVNGGGLKITVPKDFETDFASIPRIFWSIMPPVGRYSKAAVLHDYLYHLPNCSRFLADALFREAMKQLGVSLWKRLVIFYSVRFFGWMFKTK
jgi:hypothetical protein